MTAKKRGSDSLANTFRHRTQQLPGGKGVLCPSSNPDRHGHGGVNDSGARKTSPSNKAIKRARFWKPRHVSSLQCKPSKEDCCSLYSTRTRQGTQWMLSTESFASSSSSKSYEGVQVLSVHWIILLNRSVVLVAHHFSRSFSCSLIR